MFVALLLAASLCGYAQNVTVAEPEFVNSYCILTSDSTYDVLPKESGTIKKHENKIKKLAKIFGNVADVAGSAGYFILCQSNSSSGIIAGARAASAASSVGSAADAVSRLSGYTGFDISFEGAHSSYIVKQTDGGIRLLIKGDSNETDPMDTYRIVRFRKSKKERRIQWFEIQPALLGTKEVSEAGYINFSGHKYGEQSYLLDIPASELVKGEYGIFFLNIITAATIPVGTFSIK